MLTCCLWLQHVPAAVTAAKAPMGLVLINLQGNASLTVEFGKMDKYTVWTITPADGPFGATVLMNGKALPGAIKDGKAIGEIPVAGDLKTGAMELAATDQRDVCRRGVRREDVMGAVALAAKCALSLSPSLSLSPAGRLRFVRRHSMVSGQAKDFVGAFRCRSECRSGSTFLDQRIEERCSAAACYLPTRAAAARLADSARLPRARRTGRCSQSSM